MTDLDVSFPLRKFLSRLLFSFKTNDDFLIKYLLLSKILSSLDDIESMILSRLEEQDRHRQLLNGEDKDAEFSNIEVL